MRFFRKLAIALFIISVGLYIGIQMLEEYTSDDTKPEIYTEETYLELSVDDPEEKLLEGLTAVDEKDGDLTDSIMIQGKSHFSDKGAVTVKYVVFDRDNNFAELSRKVYYTDYHSPEFTLSEPLDFARNKNVSILDYVQATDLLDGDITNKVKVSGSSVDMTTSGVYPVSLEVTNSYGDRSIVDTNVVVRDGNSSPRIVLKDSLVYVDKGSEFEASDYIDSVIASGGAELEVEGYNVYESGVVVCSIHVTGEVDTDEPGCYQLEYSYQTSRSNGFAYLTVVVRE